MTEDKSVEDLMKRRVKMIAPIPKVFSCGIEVGQIWHEQDGFYNLTGAHRIGLVEIKRYPHLFKEISWWEERKIDDMPEYLTNGEIVIKVIEHFRTNRYSMPEFKHDESSFLIADNKECLYRNYTPSTEEEYLKYINQKA